MMRAARNRVAAGKQAGWLLPLPNQGFEGFASFVTNNN